MNFKVDFSKYPLNSEDLVIRFRDPKLTRSRLVYKPIQDMSGIDMDTFTLTRWEYDNTTWTIEERDYSLPGKSEPFSEIRFTIRVTRPHLFGILIAFLPPMFIMTMIFATYSLPIAEMTTRISMVGSGLIGLVLFHTGLPTTQHGQVTFIDSFFLTAYAFIVGTFIFNIVVLKTNDENQSDSMKKFGEKLNRVAEGISWTFVPFIMFFFWYPLASPFILLFTIISYFIFRLWVFPKLRSLLAGGHRGKAVQAVDEIQMTEDEDSVYSAPSAHKAMRKNSVGSRLNLLELDEPQGRTDIEKAMFEDRLNGNEYYGATSEVPGSAKLDRALYRTQHTPSTTDLSGHLLGTHGKKKKAHQGQDD